MYPLHIRRSIHEVLNYEGHFTLPEDLAKPNGGQSDGQTAGSGEGGNKGEGEGSQDPYVAFICDKVRIHTLRLFVIR